MNALDAAVFIIVLGLALLGFKRGFARELVETFGAIVAAVVAYRYSMDIARLADIHVSETWWSSFLVIIGVFVTCMIVITVAGRLLSRFIKSISLGMYDHLAGFVLGALKGGMLVAVVSLGLLWIGDPGEKVVSESRFARANLMVFEWLSLALPDDLEEKYAVAVSGLKRRADEYRQMTEPHIAVASSLTEEFLKVTKIRGNVQMWDSEVDTGTVAFEYEGDPRTAHISALSFVDGHIDSALIQPGVRIEFTLTYLLSENKLYARSPAVIE